MTNPTKQPVNNTCPTCKHWKTPQYTGAAGECYGLRCTKPDHPHTIIGPKSGHAGDNPIWWRERVHTPSNFGCIYWREL